MGMDVAFGTHEYQDENAIVISHMVENEIVIDFVDHKRADHMGTIVGWVGNLKRKWSVKQGIVDEPRMARALELDYVPSISTEMSHIFDFYRHKVIISEESMPRISWCEMLKIWT